MQEILEHLLSLLGSPSKVADYLQYSDRHLRNIRRKIEKGQLLNPRVQLWITTKHDQLKDSNTRNGA